jgi:hypothetical protein
LDERANSGYKICDGRAWGTRGKVKIEDAKNLYAKCFAPSF